MHPLQTLVQMVEFAGQNIAHNLEFIPEDKLNWKPEPTAKSALEIVLHIVPILTGMAEALRSGKFGYSDISPVTTRAEAQQLIRSASREYARALLSLTPERLSETIDTPLGSNYTLDRAAGIPVFDLIHHHGQIVYIQSLLGDTEDHFFHLSG